MAPVPCGLSPLMAQVARLQGFFQGVVKPRHWPVQLVLKEQLKVDLRLVARNGQTARHIKVPAASGAPAQVAEGATGRSPQAEEGV